MRIKHHCEQVSLCLHSYLLSLSLSLRLYFVWVSGKCGLLNVKEEKQNPALHSERASKRFNVFKWQRQKGNIHYLSITFEKLVENLQKHI